MVWFLGYLGGNKMRLGIFVNVPFIFELDTKISQIYMCLLKVGKIVFFFLRRGLFWHHHNVQKVFTK